jgi:hypothetical protein
MAALMLAVVGIFARPKAVAQDAFSRPRRLGVGDRRAIASLESPREPRSFPRRAELNSAEFAVNQTTTAAFAASGVLRDGRGLPVFDVAPEMAPIYARGLHWDHGVYHEMSRGDAAIAGAMGGLRRTIGSATYVVPEIPDETAGERTARELVADYFGVCGPDLGVPSPNLDGALEGGLTRHLDQAAAAKVYGFSAFRIVPSIVRWRDRLVMLPTRVAWIAPWSIARWLWHGDRLVGLTQVQQKSSDYRGSFGTSMVYPMDWAGYGWQYEDIPISQVVLYTHQHADGNPEGTSDLRPLWTPWRAKKDTILRHEAAEESQFQGHALIKERATPDGQKFKGCIESVQEELEEAADLLVDGGVKRLTVPYSYELSVEHPEYQIPSPVPMLDWYNKQIFLGLQAILLGLPDSHAGSASMTDAADTLLVGNLEQSSEELLAVTNGLPGPSPSGLVDRIVAWNFAPGTIKRRPRLSVLGFSNVKTLSSIVRELGQFRLITPSAEDEQVMRHRARLPVQRLSVIRSAREAERSQPTQSSQAGTQVPQ